MSILGSTSSFAKFLGREGDEKHTKMKVKMRVFLIRWHEGMTMDSNWGPLGRVIKNLKGACGFAAVRISVL
jgi:hypothetical protein